MCVEARAEPQVSPEALSLLYFLSLGPGPHQLGSAGWPVKSQGSASPNPFSAGVTSTRYHAWPFM